MRSISGMLNAGTNGMKTAQAGLAVHSNNATNVSTSGYTRKSVTIESLSPYGLGSRATGVRSSLDSLVEKRLVGSTSLSSGASANAQALKPLDTIFGEGAGTIGAALDAFHAAIGDVADDPHATAPRTVLLERAGQLARAFQSASSSLDASRVDANARITDSVRVVNGKLEDIARLNAEIGNQSANGGNATDLMDRRALLVKEVAEALPIQTFTDGQGRVSVMLGGTRSLVDGANGVTPLRTSTDSAGNVRLERTTAGAVEDVTGLATSGSIGGIIAARDGALATSASALDRLALDVSSAYNAAHTAGVGLDGSSGRALFDTGGATTGAASRLVVSSDVAGHPERIAAASGAGSLPGGNDNALALMSVATSKVASGGTSTLGDAYGAMVATAGSAVRDAMSVESQTSAATDQISAIRDSVSGVSSDEEMVAIMQFQRAFESSLKVIQTADELLQTLINLKR